MSKIIIASGPVIVEDGKVLLNKHGEDSFWKFCGGRIEDTESSLQKAAEREVFEEMGLAVSFLPVEPFFMLVQKKVADGEIDVILVHFLADRCGEVKPGPVIREWAWLDIKDLEKEHLAPNILPTLKHFGFI